MRTKVTFFFTRNKTVLQGIELEKVVLNESVEFNFHVRLLHFA